MPCALWLIIALCVTGSMGRYTESDGGSQLYSDGSVLVREVGVLVRQVMGRRLSECHLVLLTTEAHSSLIPTIMR